MFCAVDKHLMDTTLLNIGVVQLTGPIVHSQTNHIFDELILDWLDWSIRIHICLETQTSKDRALGVQQIRIILYIGGKTDRLLEQTTMAALLKVSLEIQRCLQSEMFNTLAPSSQTNEGVEKSDKT